MKIETFKAILETKSELKIKLPNGEYVPSHFHVTEVGQVDKRFIDCGGTQRTESVVNFQLWNADDYDHRLHPEKLVNIIALSQDKLQIGNHEIEVEYQGETIGKYGIDYDGTDFRLTSKQTDCLALDSCGIPAEKPKLSLSNLTTDSDATCTPGSGCC